MKSLIAVAAIVLLLVGCMPDYSEGERAGLVTKFSHKGMFCKTWEGEMNLGGMREETQTNASSDGKSFTTSTAMVPNVWKFTVTNESLVRKVQAALADGKRVTFAYTQWLIGPPCSTDSGSIVTAVKP